MKIVKEQNSNDWHLVKSRKKTLCVSRYQYSYVCRFRVVYKNSARVVCVIIIESLCFFTVLFLICRQNC